MQPAQHGALVLGLPDLDLLAELLAGPLAEADEVGVRLGAVHVRLARAEPAEVRAVEDEDHAATSPHAAASSSGAGSARMPGLPTPSSTTNRSTEPRAFLSTRIASDSSGHASAR